MLSTLLIALFYGYVALGAIFGVYFVIRGAARIDADAHGLSVGMRLLLWPASVGLWPILVRKMLMRPAGAMGEVSPNGNTDQP